MCLAGKKSRKQPKHTFTSKRICAVTALTLLAASHSYAQVPAVLVGAQQTIGNNFYNPQDAVVAPNGTVYVADTSNNQVIALTTNLPGASVQTKIATTGYNLTSPRGLAIDAAGDLYIGDTPVLGATGRIVEVMATNGVLNGHVKLIYAGGLLDQPVSLALDNANNLFIGNHEAALLGSIYRISAGSSLPVKVNVTGLPATFLPSSMVIDATNHLWMANGEASSGGVYRVAETGGAIQSLLSASFVFTQPTGLALDASGNLFVLARLSSGITGEQIIEVPNPSVSVQTTPFLIPTSNISNVSALTIDPTGNLDVVGIGALRLGIAQKGNGIVTQIDYLNPIYLGAAKTYGTGTGVTFNFELNAPNTFGGLRAITVGDPGTSSDVTAVSGSGTCTTGKKTGLTQFAPYTCYQTFAATPQYTGTRLSSIQIKGAGTTILNSSAVYELGQSAAQIAYPLDVTMTQLGLIEPQGVAISGFDQTVYIADQTAGKVFSLGGMNGAKPTALYTGAPNSSTALAGPTAVAMNGRGDLYIADFSKGAVIVVPTTTGIAPFVLNAGGLLKHPISLALDDLGDLFVGDAGLDGDGATSSAPGYVVEIPYRGSPFKVPTPGVKVIFPQAVAVNSITGDLFIGDGGDVTTAIGQVVDVPAFGNAHVVSITKPAVPTDPTGLGFDAAGNLYVLDGMLDTITVVAPNGETGLLPISNGASLNAASAMATTAGSQSLVITNLGGGAANSLVYLNGNSATLAFGNQTVKTASASQSVTVTNIGNQPLTLKQNFYSPKSIPGFNAISGTTTCAAGDSLTGSSPACSFPWEFQPTTVGTVKTAVAITSNAYNSGVGQITLSGSGVAKAKAAAATAEGSLQRVKRAGRKSFAGSSK